MNNLQPEFRIRKAILPNDAVHYMKGQETIKYQGPSDPYMKSMLYWARNASQETIVLAKEWTNADSAMHHHLNKTDKNGKPKGLDVKAAKRLFHAFNELETVYRASGAEYISLQAIKEQGKSAHA